MSEIDATLGRDPDVHLPARQADQPVEQYFVVRLASVLYAFRASDVRRVIPAMAPVRVPTAPAVFLGLVYHEGTLVPVVDIITLFGHAAPEEGYPGPAGLAGAPGQRLVILETSGQRFALLGETLGLRDVAPDAIRPALGVHTSGPMVVGHFDAGREVLVIVRASSVLEALLGEVTAAGEKER